MGDGARSWGTRVVARPHACALLLLGACVFGYLWPVLVGGKILSPAASLYAYVPWTGLAPSDVGSYLNTQLIDLPLVDYPWRFLVRSLLHAGTFPAWNPYALSGIPLYSNPQTGLFSPFNLPLWILPLTYGLGVSAALKLLAGAFGAYLLVRQLRLGFLPALLAGIVFAFSAINIVWLAHETLPAVIVLLPWALWLVERIFERGRPATALALVGVIALGISGGHPGMQVHLLAVVAAYALVRAACLRGAPYDDADPDAARPGLGRALALVAGGLVAGALLMAFMLIPEARSSHGTVGVLARHGGELPGSRMPAEVLGTIAFPDWWGRPSGAEAPHTDANLAALMSGYCERTFYAGTVALLLACIGLLSPGGWRRKLPFALLAVAGLAIAVRTPGLIWLATHLPGLELVASQRLHLTYALGAAVLAAFGLQAVLDAPAAGGRRRLAVVLGALLLGVAALVIAAPGDAAVRATVRHFLTGASYPRSGVLALTTIAWFLLFAVGSGVLLLVARVRPAWRTGVVVALVLLAVADAYHFVHGFQPMGPEARVMPPETPAIAYLARHRDDGRVVGVNDALPPDSGLVYGLRDVRGYDPPQPTRRMLDLWRLANPQQISWTPLTLPTIGQAQLHVLGVLGVRYLVVDPGTRVPRRELPQLSTVYAGDDATVLASSDVAPRAFVPRTIRLTADEAESGRTIVEAGFDPRTDVTLAHDQAGAPGLVSAAVRGSAAVVHEQNARVTVRARLDGRGLVVLGDSLIPGWSVRVDGEPATPVHVNSVMRGVIVPPGNHEIVWSYAVPGLRLGLLVSGLTLALLVATGIAVALADKRSSARRLVPILRG